MIRICGAWWLTFSRNKEQELDLDGSTSNLSSVGWSIINIREYCSCFWISLEVVKLLIKINKLYLLKSQIIPTFADFVPFFASLSYTNVSQKQLQIDWIRNSCKLLSWRKEILYFFDEVYNRTYVSRWCAFKYIGREKNLKIKKSIN